MWGLYGYTEYQRKLQQVPYAVDFRARSFQAMLYKLVNSYHISPQFLACGNNGCQNFRLWQFFLCLCPCSRCKKLDHTMPPCTGNKARKRAINTGVKSRRQTWLKVQNWSIWALVIRRGRQKGRMSSAFLMYIRRKVYLLNLLYNWLVFVF